MTTTTATKATTTTTDTSAVALATATALSKALSKASAAGTATLVKAYGLDTREYAPKSLSTAIKYARDAARVIAGDAKLPSAGERRTFIQRISETVSALGVFTETSLVEAARDVLAADRKRRAVARAAEVQTKREHAAALNAAIRNGDTSAAAEAAGIAAADMANQVHAKRETAAQRFANACQSAVASGIPLVSLFETLASAAGVDNPVFTVPADTGTVAK